MLAAFGQLLIGMPLLVLGAEFLVRGASQLARAVGISPLVVGLTVVAYGTSAPELAVSVLAALTKRPDLSLGNIVGSNIANILIVLGFAAVVSPLHIAAAVWKWNVPLMISFSVLLALFAWDGTLGRIEGLIFLLCAVGYTVAAIVLSRRATKAGRAHEASPAGPQKGLLRLVGSVALVVLGLVGLIWGADWFVEAASTIAKMMGVSELVIGLTVVAVGTSLPEIATSCWAAIRGQRDVAVGNAIGSNIINIVGIAGISAAVAPAGIAVSEDARWFDIPVMVGVSVIVWPVLGLSATMWRIEGAVFLLYYVAYAVTLYYRAVGQLSNGWPLLGGAMAVLVGILPLSIWGWFFGTWGDPRKPVFGAVEELETSKE